MASAELDLSKITKIRQEMPVSQHRRHDLYGLVTANNSTIVQDDSDSIGYHFGPHQIPSNQVVSFGGIPLCVREYKTLQVAAGFCIGPRLRHCEPEASAALSPVGGSHTDVSQEIEGPELSRECGFFPMCERSSVPC